jgi:hypothetical protein
VGKFNHSEKDYANIFGYIYSVNYEGHSVYYVVLNKFQSEKSLNEAYVTAKNAEEMSKILLAKRDLYSPIFSSCDKNKALVFLAKEALSAGFGVDDFD